jgi:tetratricopeptide (TPR) repeat protein
MWDNLIAKGKKAYNQGDYEESAICFKKVLEVDPNNKNIEKYYDRSFGFTKHFIQNLNKNPKTRIYILGCGRSGTTLLLSLMTCFNDTYALINDANSGGEDYFGRFARMDNQEEIHVIKRSSDAYKYAELIPQEIDLLYIIRHPLDVLVSTLFLDNKEYSYYISVERWLGEIASLRRLMGMKREKMLIIKYEDIILEPDASQNRISEYFQIDVKKSFSLFHEDYLANSVVEQSMSGVRPLSSKSIRRWRKNRNNIEYCKSIFPSIENDLMWVCDIFSYDFNEIKDTIVL